MDFEVNLLFGDFEGLDPFFRVIEEQAFSHQDHLVLAHFMAYLWLLLQNSTDQLQLSFKDLVVAEVSVPLLLRLHGYNAVDDVLYNSTQVCGSVDFVDGFFDQGREQVEELGADISLVARNVAQKDVCHSLLGLGVEDGVEVECVGDESSYHQRRGEYS